MHSRKSRDSAVNAVSDCELMANLLYSLWKPHLMFVFVFHLNAVKELVKVLLDRKTQTIATI